MTDNAYELQPKTADGEKITVCIAADAPPELVSATIASVTVPGALDASLAIEAALADRTA